MQKLEDGLVKQHPVLISHSTILRLALIIVGLACTVLALLGIFMPLLPTVPLLLLAAACFARSSERIHGWLLGHPHLGPLILNFQNGQGMPLRAKVSAIALVWVTIPVSVLFFIPLLWVKVSLIVIGLSVTIYLLRMPICAEVEK
ncbi:MAG: YbaN family protein [Desulfuromonadales bacterium]|nr:YbaN family protein [Desulfuromonadales bacterium]